MPCTGYPGGYAVSRGPSIFLDKKAKGRVPPLLNLSTMIEGPLLTECDLSLEEQLFIFPLAFHPPTTFPPCFLISAFMRMYLLVYDQHGMCVTGQN